MKSVIFNLHSHVYTNNTNAPSVCRTQTRWELVDVILIHLTQRILTEMCSYSIKQHSFSLKVQKMKCAAKVANNIFTTCAHILLSLPFFSSRAEGGVVCAKTACRGGHMGEKHRQRLPASVKRQHLPSAFTALNICPLVGDKAG